MVIMSVGDKHATDIFFFTVEIRDVRDQIINARHILVRKLESHIQNNYILAIFKDGHVAADLSQPAKRDDAQISAKSGVSVAGHGASPGTFRIAAVNGCAIEGSGISAERYHYRARF